MSLVLGNVTAYREMQCVCRNAGAPDEVDGAAGAARGRRGCKRMRERIPWSKLFPYVYAINLRREKSIALILSREILFRKHSIPKRPKIRLAWKPLLNWNVVEVPFRTRWIFKVTFRQQREIFDHSLQKLSEALKSTADFSIILDFIKVWKNSCKIFDNKFSL